ncbi:MAG: glycosyltransferase family 4 protein [Planctomycetaceae bacterium]
MLAVVDRLRRRQGAPAAGPRTGNADFEFTAVAPPTGPLADALQQRDISVLPLAIRDDSGDRLPLDVAVRSLAESLQSANADLIHANSLSLGRLLGALGDEFDVPRVAHLRDIVGLSGAAIADLNRNDRLTAVSRATRDFHLTQGLNPGTSCVVCNGVDCEAFRPRPATGTLKRELGLPESAFLVLTVGQIGLRKGQDVLVEAAARLNAAVAAHVLPDACPLHVRDVHYVVVGERNSAKRESVEFENALLRRCEEAGMADRFHLTGYRDDVPRLMNEAGLLVHPAHQEPFGRVLLEAAASGLAIIATSVGGTPEVLQDGVSARLIPPGDSDSLADAIAELARDADLRERLASAARARIESRFSVGVATTELTQTWHRLLAPAV